MSPSHSTCISPLRLLPVRAPDGSVYPAVKQYPAKEQAELRVRIMLSGNMFPGLTGPRHHQTDHTNDPS